MTTSSALAHAAILAPDPVDADELLRRAEQAMARGDFDEAYELLSQACEGAPERGDLRHRLALACRGLGWSHTEMTQLAHALELNPYHRAAMVHQGIAWCEQGRDEEGLARISQALEWAGEQNTEPFEESRRLLRQGMREEAIARLEELAH